MGQSATWLERRGVWGYVVFMSALSEPVRPKMKGVHIHTPRETSGAWGGGSVCTIHHG